jgi:diguanylate cyclase (GGDEF)-like protein
MIDLERFDNINKAYGFSTGDSVLNRVANVLVASAPAGALVCRYAGDRFIVLQPQNLADPEDTRLGQLLTHAVAFALSNMNILDIDCQVRIARVSVTQFDNADDVLAHANELIIEKKQC